MSASTPPAFISESLFQHWLLTTNQDEITECLEEIHDSFLSFDVVERRTFDTSSMIFTIKKLLENIQSKNKALQNSGLRLLNVILVEFPSTYIAISSPLQETLKLVLGHNNDGIRTTAYRTAFTFILNVDFSQSAKAITSWLKESKDNIESYLSLSVVSLLRLINTISSHSSSRTDSRAGTALVRMATMAYKKSTDPSGNLLEECRDLLSDVLAVAAVAFELCDETDLKSIKNHFTSASIVSSATQTFLEIIDDNMSDQYNVIGLKEIVVGKIINNTYFFPSSEFNPSTGELDNLIRNVSELTCKACQGPNNSKINKEPHMIKGHDVGLSLSSHSSRERLSEGRAGGTSPSSGHENGCSIATYRFPSFDNLNGTPNSQSESIQGDGDTSFRSVDSGNKGPIRRSSSSLALDSIDEQYSPSWTHGMPENGSSNNLLKLDADGIAGVNLKEAAFPQLEVDPSKLKALKASRRSNRKVKSAASGSSSGRDLRPMVNEGIAMTEQGSSPSKNSMMNSTASRKLLMHPSTLSSKDEYDAVEQVLEPEDLKIDSSFYSKNSSRDSGSFAADLHKNFPSYHGEPSQSHAYLNTEDPLVSQSLPSMKNCRHSRMAVGGSTQSKQSGIESSSFSYGSGSGEEHNHTYMARYSRFQSRHPSDQSGSPKSANTVHRAEAQPTNRTTHSKSVDVVSEDKKLSPLYLDPDEEGDQSPAHSAMTVESHKSHGVSRYRRKMSDEELSPLTQSEPHIPKGKLDAFEYTASEDIKPSGEPMKDLSQSLSSLEVQEWPDIFHTLNVLRQLALHHSSLLVGNPALHHVVGLVMKCVGNLRSQLSKNALMTIGDFFTGLKKAMDVEVHSVVPGLIKRSSDSSIFLVESADVALRKMIDSVSLHRSLAGLLSQTDHRSPIARGKVASLLLILVSTRLTELKTHQKELDTLKSRIPKLIHDQTPDARSNSREVLRLLLSHDVISRQSIEGSAVSPDLIDKILLGPQIGYSPKSAINTPVTGRRGRKFDFRTEDEEETLGTPQSQRSRSVRRRHENESPLKPTSAIGQKTGPPSRSVSRSRRGRAGTASLSPTSDLSDHDPSTLQESAERLGAMLDSRLMLPHIKETQSEKSDLSMFEDLPQLNLRETGQKKVVPRSAQAGQSPMRSARTVAKAAHVTAAAKRTMEEEPDLVGLVDLMEATAAKNWLERRDAMTKLTDLMICHFGVLRDAGKLNACLDRVLERLEDGSVKVHAHVVECLEKMMEKEPLLLQHEFIQITAPALLNSAASSNKIIGGKSLTILKSLFDTVSPVQVAQFLSKASLHDRDKIRLMSLKVLSEVMPVFCFDQDSIQSIAKKIIFPALCKIMFGSSTKGDLRVAASETIKSMQTGCSRFGQEKLWKWCDSTHQQEEVKRLTFNL